MVNENNVQDRILDALAQKIFDEYNYLQVDTSTLLPGDAAVELTNSGTQIGNSAALFNKIQETSTLQTTITDNKAVKLFILASGEPFSQPVNLGSLAIMDQVTAGAGMGLSTALPVTFTKDNTLAAKIRAEFSVIRVDEV